MQATLGEIRIFAGNYAPKGWALCNGQLMPVLSNEGLYHVIGNAYGGNPGRDFYLPDLRGQVAMGAGTGPGLTSRNLGLQCGEEAITLTTDNLPEHTHAASVQLDPKMPVSSSSAGKKSPKNNFLAVESSAFYASSPSDQYLADPSLKLEVSVEDAGQHRPDPVNNMAPTIALNYIIAIQGQVPQVQ